MRSEGSTLGEFNCSQRWGPPMAMYQNTEGIPGPGRVDLLPVVSEQRFCVNLPVKRGRNQCGVGTGVRTRITPNRSQPVQETVNHRVSPEHCTLWITRPKLCNVGRTVPPDLWRCPSNEGPVGLPPPKPPVIAGQVHVAWRAVVAPATPRETSQPGCRRSILKFQCEGGW